LQLKKNFVSHAELLTLHNCSNILIVFESIAGHIGESMGHTGSYFLMKVLVIVKFFVKY